MKPSVEKVINKDLILRERLAIQRTFMANQTTLLSFIRTALYFLVAGLSIRGFFKLELLVYLEVIFFTISLVLLIYGLHNFFRNKKIIEESRRNIGNYQDDYYASDT
jgi:putative membrane protein